MEDSRFLIIILLIFIGIGVSIQAFAYSPDTTHQALSDEMVNFFNLHFSAQKLTNKEKQIIMQGSSDEDARLPVLRPMQHFYDPIYNRGLVLVGNQWMSSKEWAQNHKEQAKYDPKTRLASVILRPFSGATDYSWERSIYEYTWGDKERGLKGLGHILHLIQDATVPEHTRNDPHPPHLDISPYEEWTKRFGPGNTNIVAELSGRQLVLLKSLDSYFNYVSSYSNKNFFSKDTIFTERYSNPKVIYEQKEKLSNGRIIIFGYGSDSVSQYKLVGRPSNSSWVSLVSGKGIEYFVTDDDNLILSDYWDLLSKQAVLHGAGVIKLFFDEVEKEKRTERLLTYNKSPADKLIGAVAALFSPTKRLQQQGLLTEELEFKEEFFADLEGEKREKRVEREENREGELPPAPVVTLTPSPAPEISEELPEPPQVVEQPKKGVNGDKEKEGKQGDKGERGGIGGGGGGSSNGSGNTSSGDNPSGGSSSSAEPPAAPTVTSPADLSAPFANATITFSGTTSPAAKISTDFSSVTSTAANDGTWSLALTLPQGTTTVSFFAEKSGAKSSAKIISVGVDSVGPNLSNFDIAECSSSLATNGCLVATTTLNLTWDEASDAENYTLECSTCGDDFPLSITATSTKVSVPAAAAHTFTLKAKDSLNNESILASEQIEVNLRPVVINELAWMGTAAHASDEWIELFNTSGFTVNLGDGTATSSWILAAADGTPTIIFNGTIESKGFFLLERTASTTTSLDEEQVYTGALGDPGEVLSLKTPAGFITDEIDANQSAGGWQNIGDKTARRTAERINPFHGGIFPYNWRTATATSTVTDADGNAILGTPKDRNSVYNETWRPTFIDDSTIITTNATWYATGSPYILESNASEIPTVAAGATLTIEPDAVLMSLSPSHHALKIEGTLKAVGSEGKDIVFTFFDDADYGGQTIGEKGKWKGIEFTASATDSLLEYTRFRYAGAGTPPTTALELTSGAAVQVKNSRFESNKGLVFNLDGDNFGGVKIQDSTFDQNGIPALADDAVILLKNSANPTINNNTFSNNDYPPVKIISSYPTIGTNTATNNFLNGIYVDDGTVIALNTTWASTLPYLLESNSGARVTVATSTTLTIEPGVILKPLNKNHEAFRVEGTLVWGGAATSSVITSQYDDDFGGDSNNDGATTTSPAVGDWIDFHFMPGSVGTLTNVKFLYGLGGVEPSQPGLKVDSGATTTLTNVVFGP